MSSVQDELWLKPKAGLTGRYVLLHTDLLLLHTDRYVLLLLKKAGVDAGLELN